MNDVTMDPPSGSTSVPAIAPADPLAAPTHADPYPYYRELARTQPFHRDPTLRLWVAAGAAEVAAVLSHPACRVRPPGQPVPPALAGTPAGTLFAGLIRMNDGEAHGPLKAVLQRQLAGLDLAEVRAVAAAWAGRLPVAGGKAATVNHWASALPVITIAAVLGWVAPGHGDVAAMEIAAGIARFASAMSPLAGPAEIAAGIDAAASLRALAGPTEGAWTAALREAAQAAGVDDEAVSINLLGLMVQSCEATAGLIGNTLLWLARDAAAANDLPATVARVLQADPPIHNTRRFMAEDACVCGVPLRRGDGILVLLAAAAVSAGPPARQAATLRERGWTFGHGAHRCPGDALAATLAEATVAALLARGIAPASLARVYRYRPSLNARIPVFL